MNQRWWAPQRGTTSPDAVVTTLLQQPGDLATTLLATHRAGAAACEAVARAPLPSEAGLVKAMATARAAFAGPVVDVVSKSMEANYAGLLVRDVLAEAESGALAIYRSAVAKGVSPPLAASRAGAVYGVPAKEMGRYFALATDPKTNPVALTDAADRALLGYVAKLVALEEEGQVVEFAKAPRGIVSESERWEEREHPRGPDGRFVGGPPTGGPPVTEEAPEPGPPKGSLAWVRQMLGLGESSPPARVAEMDTRTPPAPPAQRQARQVRQQRQQRQVRAQRAPVATRPGLKPTLRPTAKPGITRTQHRAILAQVNEGAHRPVPKPSRELVPTSPDLTPDLLKTLGPNRPDIYHDLYDPVAMVADREVMDTLVHQMANQSSLLADPDRRLFRMHHLLASPRTSLPENADATGAINHLLDAQAEDIGAPEMAVDHIHPRELLDANPAEITGMLERRRRDAVTEVHDVGGNLRRVTNEEELAHVHVLPEYEPYGKEEFDEHGNSTAHLGHAVVHFEQEEGHENFYDRNYPTVDEVVVIAPMGREEGGERHKQVILDPNAAYELVKDPSFSAGYYEEFWHSRLGVVVRRWYVRFVSEDEVDEVRGGKDVGKALKPTEAIAFEVLHPRDAHGRFAETEETAVAPPAEQPVTEPSRAPRRQQRAERQQRQQRQQRQIRAAGGTAALRASIRATHGQQARKPGGSEFRRVILRRAQERAESQDRPLPELADWQDYILLSGVSMNSWLETNFSDAEIADLHYQPPGDVELTMYMPARRQLAESKKYRSSELANRMAYNVQDDMGRQGEISTKGLARMPLTGVHDEEAVAQRVDALFDEHPEVDIIEIVQAGAHLHFYGNRSPADEQNIIETDPDIDWDKPVYLTYMGQYRARDMSSVGPDGSREPLVDVVSSLGEDKAGEGAVANPSLHVYRITSSKVRRYRASND